MAASCFVAGDWGTSHLRLSLCDRSGKVLDCLSGPGIASVKVSFPTLYESLLKNWEARYGSLPAVLCGMVGSSIGWAQAPYVDCPAPPQAIAAGCIALRAGGVHVVPGIRCSNRLKAADFMRGEETQLLGALTLDPILRAGRHLVCLPGTHTKWALLKEGVITEFLSAPTGELFAVLRDHSVLARGAAQGDAAGTAFEAGVRRYNEFPQAQILHRLFECRSRVLAGEMSAPDAAGFLSGLLIASDVSGALDLFASDIGVRTVYLVGAPTLTQLYASALAAQACAARQLDGATASIAGLTQVHQHLTARVASVV